MLSLTTRTWCSNMAATSTSNMCLVKRRANTYSNTSSKVVHSFFNNISHSLGADKAFVKVFEKDADTDTFNYDEMATHFKVFISKNSKKSKKIPIHLLRSVT